MEKELKKTLIEIAEKEEYENDIALIDFNKKDYRLGLIHGSDIKHRLDMAFCNWLVSYIWHNRLDSKIIVSVDELYKHWCTTDEYKQVLLTIKNEKL